jgi:hypothetical protein
MNENFIITLFAITRVTLCDVFASLHRRVTIKVFLPSYRTPQKKYMDEKHGLCE